MEHSKLRNIDKLFVFVHDGVFHATSGAGSSNGRFIQTIAKIYPEIAKIIAPIKAKENGNSYDSTYYKKIQKLIKNSNGVIAPIENDTQGEHLFGGIANWKIVTKNSLEIINKYSSEKENILVISFDTAFAGLLKDLAKYPNVIHVHIPRSTGLLHNKKDINREKFEKDMFSYANSYQKSYLGATSYFMHKHLEKGYDVVNSKILDVINGVLLESETKKLSSMEITKIEESLGIPIKTKYVLSYGRAEKYKGFHILLRTLSLMEPTIRPFFYIIAAEYLPNSEYGNQLKNIIKKSKLKGILSTRFEPDLPRILQQSDNLIATIVPSLEEPFGLIPIETMANTLCKSPVIASDAGGLKRQVIQGKTGFLYRKNKPNELAEQIIKVTQLSKKEKEKIKCEALNFVANTHDYEKNIYNFFENLQERIAKNN